MVELIGEYGFMLPLIVSCLIADDMRSEPIYEALGLRTQRLATPPAP